MNEPKICPLLALATSPTQDPALCLGKACAWWNTTYNLTTQKPVGGECAILTIGDTLDAIEKRGGGAYD